MVKGFLEEKLRMTLKALLKNVPKIIKQATDDQDLPKFGKDMKDDAIDIVWHNVEEEIIREIEAQTDRSFCRNDDGVSLRNNG